MRDVSAERTAPGEHTIGHAQAISPLRVSGISSDRLETWVNIDGKALRGAEISNVEHQFHDSPWRLDDEPERAWSTPLALSFEG